MVRLTLVESNNTGVDQWALWVSSMRCGKNCHSMTGLVECVLFATNAHILFELYAKALASFFGLKVFTLAP